MKSERILVVDDDEKICQILTLYLNSKGYDVITCKNGGNAMTQFLDSKPDLVILDILLPGTDGFELLSRIRRLGSVPVIMLSMRSAAEDRILALDLGADDYIVKPFDSKELLARIRAVLRRAASGSHSFENGRITIGELVLDTVKLTVESEGSTVLLTGKEFELLKYLLLNRNCAVTRSEIASEVWGNDNQGSRSIDVHIRRLRSKLPVSNNWNIETVWRVGYRLNSSF